MWKSSKTTTKVDHFNDLSPNSQGVEAWSLGRQVLIGGLCWLTPVYGVLRYGDGSFLLCEHIIVIINYSDRAVLILGTTGRGAPRRVTKVSVDGIVAQTALIPPRNAQLPLIAAVEE